MDLFEEDLDGCRLEQGGLLPGQRGEMTLMGRNDGNSGRVQTLSVQGEKLALDFTGN